MTEKSKARRLALRAVAILFAGCAAGLAFPRAEVALVAGGFVGYVLVGSRALAVLHADEEVFTNQPDKFPSGPPATPFGAAAIWLLASATALAQQTIFNVPSADVLDPGRVYAEVDELFRPTAPAFSTTTIRGVYGVAPGVEAGVNFGGLSSPGPTIPTATAAVKFQPVHEGGFTLTAGGYGLVDLRGGHDGNPSGMGYGFASYRIPGAETRIDFGGWYSSAGFAKSTSTGGALASLEQPLPWLKGLTLAADWYSGVNTIGYFSPGFIYAAGPWTAYAAYTIKNGDSKGNGGLIELGYSF